MIIKEYDNVVLKSGETATIVEVLENGKTFIADIKRKDDYDTECVVIDEIEKVKALDCSLEEFYKEDAEK